MPRLLAVACVLLAGIAPISAGALGLGEIDLKSALNQRFVAEIPISSASTEDLSAVKVELASASTFDRYGLDRPAFLSNFQFSLSSSSGKDVIRIVSSEPVSEPFITMLLEVSWPQGKLLREYTVLLDPPVFASPSPSTAQAPSPATTPAAAVTPPPPATAVQPQPAAPPPVRPSVPVNVPSTARAGDDYGPVQRNETLWAISSRLRPDSSVAINQMMVAIYRANPEAFDGNINRLKQGAILRVPDQNELAQVGVADALNEVKRQNSDWRSEPVASAQAGEGRLRLVAPVEEVSEPSTEQTASEFESDAAASGDRRPAADAAAQRQIQDLESQLEDSERLIELRDLELQALQERLALLDDRDADAVTQDPFLPDSQDSPETVPGEGAGTEPAPEVEPEPETAAAESEADADAEMPAVVTVEPEPSFIWSLLTNIWLWAGLVVVVLAALFIARRRQTDEPTGRWEALQPDDDQGDEAAREATERLRALRVDEDTFVVEEQPLESSDDSMALDPTVTNYSDDDSTVRVDEDAGSNLEGTLADDVEEELPLERTIRAESAVNLDDADPIAEADFHMAYGLYDQAADILIGAQEAEPDRGDLRQKLLEVYFVWENKDAFLKQATLFRESISDEADPHWNKVLIMGKQICPDESLFAASPGAADSIDVSVGDGEGGGLDFAFEEEQPADTGLDFDLAAPADEDGLDFDIGNAFAEDDSPSAAATVVDFGGRESSSTIESPTIDTPGPASATVETPTIETPGPASGTVETPTIETPAAISTDQTGEIEIEDLGLDLEDLDGLDDIADEFAEDDQPTGFDLDEASAEADTEMFSDGKMDATSDIDTSGTDFLSSDDLGGPVDVDSTSEMRAVDDPDELVDDLEGLTAALENSTPSDLAGETAEQPMISSDTLEQPSPTLADPVDDDFSETLLAGADDPESDLDLDLDLALDDGDELAVEEMSAGATDAPRAPGIGPEGPTMTEVGTKLDLARAYVDMGDPDGARSILSEVLEEGEEAQRQEAQKLLEDLDA
jgi:pilus assembly protein FimV